MHKVNEASKEAREVSPAQAPYIELQDNKLPKLYTQNNQPYNLDLWNS